MRTAIGTPSMVGNRVLAHIAALACLVSFALGAGAATAAETIEGDAAKGRDFALENCARCHIVAKQQQPPTPPVPTAPSFLKLATDPEVTPFYLRAFFRTPHRNMPDIILKTDERDDVIAYILSLRPKK